MKLLLSIIIVMLGLTSVLYAQDSSRQKSMEFLSQFEGRWQCQGAFTKDNRPLKADITFAPVLEGKAFKYEHKDRPPNSFHALGIWNIDGASNKLTYTFASTLKGNKDSSSRYFVGKIVDPATLVLTADTLAAPPFRANRYVYEVKAKDKFKYQWQVYTDGDWKTGDYLNCSKAL